MNIEEANDNLIMLKYFLQEEGDENWEKYCEAIETLLTAYEKEKGTSHYIQSQLDIANAKLVEEKEKNKKAEELYMQHNQMIIDILKECDYMIKNRYYMNDIAIRQYAEKIKDIAKYYIKEPEWIEIEED